MTNKHAGEDFGSEKRAKTLKQAMIEAGVVVLERDQLRLITDSISYAKVFSYLEEKYAVRITRASVHKRIWESHNHFRQDVLNEAIGYFPTVLPDKRIVNIFKDTLKAAYAEPTIEQRIDTFMRIVFGATREIFLQSPARRHLQSAKAVSSRFNDPHAASTFPTLLNNHLETVSRMAVGVFAGLKTQLGIRGDVSVGLDSEAIANLTETLRSAIDCGSFLNSHAGSTAAIQPVRFKGIEQDAEYAWFPASIGQNLIVRYLHTSSGDAARERPQLEADVSPDPNSAGLPEQHVSEPNVRRQREELRQLVLAGGVDLLLNTASELKPASLTYANVFRYIKETSGTVVHRASVHKRIWQTQEDFVFDVLNHSLTRPMTEPPAGHDAALPSQSDSADESTSRRQKAQDHIRVVSRSKASLFSESTEYRLLLLTKATLFGRQGPKTVNLVRETIQRIDDEFVTACELLTKSRLLNLEFGVRPELDISEDEALEIFGTLLLTVITGLNFDHMAGVESSFQSYKLPRVDRIGEMEEWTLEGIAAWIFFDQLFVENF